MSESEDWTPEVLITKEAKKICLEMRPVIEDSVGKTFEGYTPLTFRRPTGQNHGHLFKVYVDVNECAHAVIGFFPSDTTKLTLIGVKYPTTASAPLTLPDC